MGEPLKQFTPRPVRHGRALALACQLDGSALDRAEKFLDDFGLVVAERNADAMCLQYCGFLDSVPTALHPVSREAMAQWGQPTPASITKARLPPAKLLALIRTCSAAPICFSPSSSAPFG